ncbi:MAG: hypothetical protein R3E39_28275 [Anaerolineae bacterium]
MNRFANIAAVCYGRLLGLYPASFRAAFADDMHTVFNMAVTDAARADDLALLLVIGRELRDLPLSVLREHQRERTRRPRTMQPTLSHDERRVWRARIFTRIAGTLLSSFMLLTLRDILTPNYQMNSSAAPFYFFLAVTCVSMLSALRWERAGGLVTMGGGIGMGLYIGSFIAFLGRPDFNVIGAILVGILWMLPFVIFGALFYKLGRHQQRQGQLVTRI